MKGIRDSYAPPNRSIRLAIGLLAVMVCMGAKPSVLGRVPASYRVKMNPYAGQPDAIAAGNKLFREYCSQCHQSDAMGQGKRPSLRSSFVQRATDGELFWVLRNGILAHGMPSWSMLPPQQRWQIISYVKSLGPGVRSKGDAKSSTASPGLSTVRQDRSQ